MNEQICARMTNVDPNAPDGPLNGSEQNVHVFESSLPAAEPGMCGRMEFRARLSLDEFHDCC